MALAQHCLTQFRCSLSERRSLIHSTRHALQPEQSSFGSTKSARAYREAGADRLYFSVRNAEEASRVARELPPPFMFGLPGHGATAAVGRATVEKNLNAGSAF
jgi:hypothetical protein